MSEMISNQAEQNSDQDLPVIPSPEPTPEVAVKPEESKLSAKQIPGTPGTPAEKAVAAYVANYKFKANEKEHEIPEFLRGVIKDADTEKYLKKLHEKAFGLDTVKPRLDKTSEELKTVKHDYQQMAGQIEELRADYQRNDLDSFFKKLQVPEEKILQWVLSKIEYSQLPPEQKAVLDAKKQAEQRAWDEHKTRNLSEQSYQQQLVEANKQMLDITLERPEYQAAAQAYDARRGQPGSFRSLVIKVGQSEFLTTGKHLTPFEATKAALELIGGIEQPKPTPMAEAAPALQAPQQNEAPKKKTIPNLGSGKPATPAKTKMRSIDDLKRAHQQLLG